MTSSEQDPGNEALMQTSRFALISIACAVIAACSNPPSRGSEDDAQGLTGRGAEGETVSILRPEIEVPEEEPTPAPLEPLRAIIGFPEGGAALDETAIGALTRLMASEQMELGGPIVLRAHSDSAGTDRANLDASETRGLAVAEWLIGQGVNPDRITIIALGEQNPIQPNALPDGSPNEAGRQANRRVEIEIGLPTEDQASAPDESEGREGGAR